MDRQEPDEHPPRVGVGWVGVQVGAQERYAVLLAVLTGERHRALDGGGLDARDAPERHDRQPGDEHPPHAAEAAPEPPDGIAPLTGALT